MTRGPTNIPGRRGGSIRGLRTGVTPVVPDVIVRVPPGLSIREVTVSPVGKPLAQLPARIINAPIRSTEPFRALKAGIPRVGGRNRTGLSRAPRNTGLQQFPNGLTVREFFAWLAKPPSAGFGVAVGTDDRAQAANLAYTIVLGSSRTDNFQLNSFAVAQSIGGQQRVKDFANVTRRVMRLLDPTLGAKRVYNEVAKAMTKAKKSPIGRFEGAVGQYEFSNEGTWAVDGWHK